MSVVYFFPSEFELEPVTLDNGFVPAEGRWVIFRNLRMKRNEPSRDYDVYRHKDGKFYVKEVIHSIDTIPGSVQDMMKGVKPVEHVQVMMEWRPDPKPNDIKANNV